MQEIAVIPVIRPATASDADSVARIYNHYILNSVITFEEEAVSASEISQRMDEVRSALLPWLVVEHDGKVVGYAYAGKWKSRCSYRFSVECSVYIDPNFAGKGYGTRLYERLFPLLKASGMHVVIGGIALPNPESIALHEKFGMTKVANFNEVGFKFKDWIDVGYWQVIL
jgi:phosphinothricin acetyltransferase